MAAGLDRVRWWAEHRRGLPISERRGDWFFVIAFTFFSITSIVTDAVNGVNGSLDPASPYLVERFIYDSYARLADPLLILNPPQVRVSAGISAFIWLPLYLFFIAAFIKGWNSARPLGLVYGGALTHGMITYMAEGIFGFMATSGWADPAVCPGCVEPNTLYYLAANSPYLIIPALMIWRMWKPNPFGVPVVDTRQRDAITVDLTGDEPVVFMGDRPIAPDRIVSPPTDQPTVDQPSPLDVPSE